MAVESALYPSQFNTNWPQQSDIISEGAGHIRLIKTVEKTTWANVAGAVLASHIELNYLVGVSGPLQSQINGKGAINGQTWTAAHVFSGSIAVPTLAQGTNTTGAASSAFVQTEFATRFPNYTAPITASTTELNRLVGVTGSVQPQIDSKGNIAGQTWTGTHAFPSTTSIGSVSAAEIGYLDNVTGPIQAQIDGKASKTGETYTGPQNFTGATVTVPTLATGATGNGAASVDFVNATAFAGALPGQAGSANKFVTTNGTNASWAWPTLKPQVITSNTVAVPGGAYLIAANGITLQVPATFANNDALAFDVIPGISAFVDWTTNNVKGVAGGVMNVLGKQSARVVRVDATYGFTEAA